MPTISEMRLYLMYKYPNSLHWHKKVQGMPTRQVVAIYKKMINKDPVFDDPKTNYHQIDLWEYMASKYDNHTEVNL